MLLMSSSLEELEAVGEMDNISVASVSSLISPAYGQMHDVLASATYRLNLTCSCENHLWLFGQLFPSGP